MERREAKAHEEGRRVCGRNETTPGTGTLFEMLGGRFFIQFADISGDFFFVCSVSLSVCFGTTRLPRYLIR